MQDPFANRFVDRVELAFHEGDPLAHAKATEAENVGLLKRQYQAIAAGDFAGALAVLADNAELEIVGPAELPFVGRWRGRDEIGAALSRNFSLLADQEPEIQALVAQGDSIVVVGRERGRYLPTGRSYEIHWVHLFRFAGGQVVSVREVADIAPLLDAMRPAVS